MTNTVHRRLALYLSGYDPRGSSHYHRLYRDQAALQSQASSHRIEVGKRQKSAQHRDCWSIQAHIEGTDTETRYEFLRWDDVVRSYWHRGHGRYLAMTCSATWSSMRDGSLWRLCKGALPMFSVAVGPFILLLLISLTAIALLVPWVLMGVEVWQGGSHGTGLWTGVWAALSLLAMAGLLWLSRFGEQRWYMGWTKRAIWFCALQGRGKTPELDTRLDEHAEYLLQCLRDPQWDEVVLIGHSFGATMASLIAGRAALKNAPALQDPRFSMLTLGQCMPILTFQSQAQEPRRLIHAAAQALGPRWLDFSAPADRCSTALVDPVEALKGLDGLDCPSPKLLSTKVASLHHPEDYQKLRRDYFQYHFHYICASQLPGAYDYFAITAGPQTLVQRFASQPTIKNWRKFEWLGGPFPELRRLNQAKAN